MPKKRLRSYRLYGGSRKGPFTNMSIAYSRGTHLWIIDVAAYSIRQAYYLAGADEWASDARSVGLRVIDRKGWSPNECIQAPYLQRDSN